MAPKQYTHSGSAPERYTSPWITEATAAIQSLVRRGATVRDAVASVVRESLERRCLKRVVATEQPELGEVG